MIFKNIQPESYSEKYTFSCSQKELFHIKESLHRLLHSDTLLTDDDTRVCAMLDEIDSHYIPEKRNKVEKLDEK